MGSLVVLRSRNAHEKHVLVQRAQLRIDQATLESDMWACGIGVMRAVEDQSAPIPGRERASLVGPLIEVFEEQLRVLELFWLRERRFPRG